MNTIRILPEKVASQIAAGEVVDRPAAVVRELVDNSIDADADRITVRVENGGKSLIRVSDNGKGMHRDDLLLCIERHATSKIESASDLCSVQTLGFRGEAIPSIASVSRMQMASRVKGEVTGYRLKLSGGKLDAIEEVGVPDGTIVEVRDLFHNLPARKKFLRADRTEMGHIQDQLARTVLPFPGIGFKLEDGGRTVLSFPPSDHVTPRLYALMGRNAAECMLESELSGGAFSISVYLAPPEMNRARGDHLFVYVNGRYVRDRLLTKAIMNGYGQRLMKGRYPQAVVFISVDAALVDVNVHPTKQEVRFQESHALFNAVVSLVERTLRRSSHPFVMPENQRPEHIPASIPPSPAYLPWMNDDTQGVVRAAEPVFTFPEAPERDLPHEGPEIIGQLRHTYILCQAKDGLIIIDQHAAHERVLYEHLKKGFAAAHIQVQTLLMPYELELSAKEAEIAVRKKEQLSRMGFELAHFGGNTFLLRSHPAVLKDVEWPAFFSEALAGLDQAGARDEVLLDEVMTIMACHGAIRAGARMSREEMSHLVSQLRELDLPTNCPHGRPVYKHFSYYELEKMFKRVV